MADPSEGKIFSLASSLIIVLVGFYIMLSKSQDKMKAIGLYALSFGLAKVVAAVAVLENQTDLMRYTAIISLVLGALFVLFGLSYLLGTSKKIVSKVLVSLFFIAVDVLRIKNACEHGGDFFSNSSIVSYAVEIAVLFLFVSLLLSKDVRINTVDAKIDNSKKLAKSMKADCKEVMRNAKARAKEEKKKGNRAEAKRIMKSAKAEVKAIKKRRKDVIRKADKIRYYTDENGNVVTEREYRAKNRKRCPHISLIMPLYTYARKIRKVFYTYNVRPSL